MKRVFEVIKQADCSEQDTYAKAKSTKRVFTHWKQQVAKLPTPEVEKRLTGEYYSKELSVAGSSGSLVCEQRNEVNDQAIIGEDHV